MYQHLMFVLSQIEYFPMERIYQKLKKDGELENLEFNNIANSQEWQ
jgi:hypothetical protein